MMEPLAQEAMQVAQHHSFLDLFLQAGWVVKSVIIGLLTASLWTWTLVISKLWMFYQCKRNASFWEDRFAQSTSWDQFAQLVMSYRDNVVGSIVGSLLQEYQNNLRSGESVSREQLEKRLEARSQLAIRQLVQIAEKNLGFIASVGSASPFIGLFGTVWGIMDSFQAIGLSQNTSLAVVAPGIAEALFATAIGLFVAIPAFIAYNRFINDVNGMEDRFDFFARQVSDKMVSSWSSQKGDNEAKFNVYR
jgi:biopolymer transport protein TolQ